MRSRLNTAFSAVLMCALPLALSFAAARSDAQTRKPTAREIAAIRDCATRNKDNLDEGERQCLFNLVADPCINKPSGDANKPTEADCYRRVEDSIWDSTKITKVCWIRSMMARRPKRMPCSVRGWHTGTPRVSFTTTRSKVRWRPRCTPPALRASPHDGRCCSSSSLDCKRQSSNVDPDRMRWLAAARATMTTAGVKPADASTPMKNVSISAGGIFRAHASWAKGRRIFRGLLLANAIGNGYAPGLSRHRRMPAIKMRHRSGRTAWLLRNDPGRSIGGLF